MIKQFGEVMRTFRRWAHVNQAAWRAIILCPDEDKLVEVWNEVLNILRIASLPIQTEDTLNRLVIFENGATIRLTVAGSLEDVQLHLDNVYFTHLIWIGEPDIQAMQFAETRKRSEVVAPEAMITVITQL